MTWVLWDILVPLLLAFGLGAILTWQVWRLFPHLFTAGTDAQSKERSLEQVEVESNAEGDDTHKKKPHSDSDSSGALSELESANITLIEERDRATLALEEQCSEAELLKSRNTELEALLAEHNANTAASSVASTAEPAPDDLVKDTNEELPKALRMVDIDDDSEAIKAEIALLKENVESLTSSLDSERRDKRTLELQLLNANNRCKKLETNANTELQAENAEVDAEVVHKADNESDSEHKIASESQVNSAGLTKITPDKSADVNADAAVDKIAEVNIESTADSSQPVELPVVSIADEFLIEPTPVSKTSRKTTTPEKQSNHANAPEGWTIPEVKPGKKERDQLTKIKGVGPVLEKLLHQSGIYFYQQVANLDNNGIDELQAKIPQFPGRIERDNWVEQAKKLHEDKYGTAIS